MLRVPDGCSRLFPAVPGTRDRKGSAAEAVAVPSAPRSEPWTLTQPASLRSGLQVYSGYSSPDTVGVFQIESRAQMGSLRRNRPASLADSADRLALVLLTCCKFAE